MASETVRINLEKESKNSIEFTMSRIPSKFIWHTKCDSVSKKRQSVEDGLDVGILSQGTIVATH